jgi:hypothetical protein
MRVLFERLPNFMGKETEKERTQELMSSASFVIGMR